MSYDPQTDFLGLMRRVGASVELERMPGLDYVVAALARAGLINLYVGQTAPTSNQSTTVWFQPASPSWTAEGIVRIWNGIAYVPATPALWQTLLSPSQYVFQSVTNVTNLINVGASLVAVQRVAPVATTLVLPKLSAQLFKPVQVVDWSSGIVVHDISVTTPDGATIMQQATWNLFSTPDQLTSATFRPSPELNAWIIAP